jgi:polysaccharide export outer membrane protein
MVKNKVLWVALVALVSGCTINRDIMFKTPTDYQFSTMPDSLDPQFRIQANDYLEFRLFANDGFKMIDIVSEEATSARNIQRSTFRYLVEWDGLVKLPLIGRQPLAGMTMREAETFLEGIYVRYYNRPFVQLSITNRRVIVFPGGGGDARVVGLDNNSTTLLEVIAQAGGVAKRGNSSHVKLFRKVNGQRKVFEFDLSDIEGLKYGDLVMQGDDVVYVQPNPELAREVLNDITPLITLLTTTLLVIGIVKGFSN